MNVLNRILALAIVGLVQIQSSAQEERPAQNIEATQDAASTQEEKSERTGSRVESRGEAPTWPEVSRRTWPKIENALPTETLPGDGVWVDSRIRKRGMWVTVWFDRQFLGDGEAYVRRSREFAGQKRTELGPKVVATLKSLSQHSYEAAEQSMRKLVEDGKVSEVRWYWIVNGFSCSVTHEGLEELKKVPGVKKIFRRSSRSPRINVDDEPKFSPSPERPELSRPPERTEFNPEQYQHPWYTRYLLADKTWKELGVSGAGTLTVVMGSNFATSPHLVQNVYRNPKEIPSNGKDDDGNGLVDDVHGFNFIQNNGHIEWRAWSPTGEVSPMHAFACASIVCGTGTKESPREFGIAPAGKWAGIVFNSSLEPALEWALEQGADTLSMSFSNGFSGDRRSHRRKMMEHAAFCGLYCVSGAGNHGKRGSRGYAERPAQIRNPADIPLAVFTVAGVQRDFSRTAFSGQGPVEWKTEHYQDGTVRKPDFAAFNHPLPFPLPDGKPSQRGLSGNSFSSPMLAGTISLMLSADPDLMPWDAREILVSTVTDVADRGFDYQTGHGMLNCYRAVREVLRRKAEREGGDTRPFTGRQEGDEINISSLREQMRLVLVLDVKDGGEAAKAGLRVGDVLVSVDSKEIKSNKELSRWFRNLKKTAGAEHLFLVRRKGELVKLTIRLSADLRFGYGVAEAGALDVFK